MCLSTSLLVGARPVGVLSCLRKFCVERIPFVKAAVMSPKSLVTMTSLVSTGAPQKNNGITLPLYFPGCAVGEGGTGIRPEAASPTGTISYLAVNEGGRIASMLRLRRSVRSRQENF